MGEIKGILFDKDGTLLDYHKSWAPVNRRLADYAARGDRALTDRLLAACGMDPQTGIVTPDSLLAAGNTREISEGLIAAGSDRTMADLVEALDRFFAEGSDHSVPVTDLAALFSSLKAAGYHLGIASSDNERSIRRTVERFGFAHLVDFIAGYDSGHGCKPEPGMLIGFARAVGVEPANVAMVGDNNHDLHMARNARAGRAIAVLTGTGSPQSLAAASDVVLDDVTQLEAWLATA